ncbi:MAG: epimerase [Sulfurimonas sp. RIFOXYD12_FULL_33_39]|uniref:NAD-dependent epimerase/dehydratase family protein n=1 Tax=unclassified Sulfurimonas TaxID=2623549 RepID=UPI0008D4BE56|nr:MULTISPECIES: NAD-dependent epimerase/dehydratase family protein [unclassified Sulfurimonas]OHE09011.1 MAG: epimerase [Sulfurimonas sp. RIFOXYD12_FULL_33_39]OHE14321.1 MAG: epimerase [Sulfurimonas sp. RIFOXYD2_FULL_34_21]
MKMLLTGSSGFIGSYFAGKYADKYDIEKFSFLRDDFNLLNLEGFDVVLHMSAFVHQTDEVNEEEYERVNVAQTFDLAKKAKESKVGHFVFLSSIKACGEDGVFDESITCNPKDKYGKSKLKAEFELQKLTCNDFKISIVRMPLVYGYGAKANMKKLINLVNKIPVLPFGGMQNARSMVYIGNLCHVINAVIEQKKSGIFLTSDDYPLSTSRLIELIANAFGKKVYLFKVPFFETVLKILKPNLYKRLYGTLKVDNSATMQKLNIKNPYTTDDAIKFMIEGEK